MRAAPFYIPTKGDQAFQFVLILAITSFEFFFLINRHPEE